MTKAPMLAYLLLALCVAASAAFCADIYAGIAGRAVDGPRARTAAQFVTMKARQAGTLDDIEAREGRAVFTEHGDGEVFLDELYWYDGWLMELYAPENAAIYGSRDEAGDKVVECDGAVFDMDGRMLSYEIEIGGMAVNGLATQRGGTGSR